MSTPPGRLPRLSSRKPGLSPGGADLQDLFEAVLGLQTQAACEKFFADLCTPGELLAMADRWKVARLLDQGMPYRGIYEKTGVSTATITRVARALFLGESGYRRALDRIKPKRKP
jgi:TrpR-related protein YerC/YecD